MTEILVTGAAGFIGSHLCRYLLNRDPSCRLVGVDNLMLGHRENVRDLLEQGRMDLLEMDVRSPDFQDLVGRGSFEKVYHLAANSDIQEGSRDITRDYEHTFNTSFAVARACRGSSVKRVFFASTSAIYGDVRGVAVDENHGPLEPISMYGAAKLASEAFLSACSFMFDFSVSVVRFPNVVGGSATHGVILDFIRKLEKDPKNLEILGDGTQCKPYLHVSDLIRAIEVVMKLDGRLVTCNVAGVGRTTVRRIADIVCREMGLDQVEYHFTGGNIGWKGDVPEFQYDIQRILSLGWEPLLDSDQSVIQATRDILRKDS